MSDDPTSDAGLAARIAAYLEHLNPTTAPVRIEDLRRVHGGASRETFRFTAVRGDGQARGLILRRDPEASLIDTERELEFSAYRSFHGTSVPVPEAIALEADPRWLDRPFFLMEEITGGTAASPFDAAPYAGIESAVGERFWSILGHIAAAHAPATPLARVADVPAPEACWRRELDYWEGVLDEDEQEPQPIARAAIRQLRRTPPPPPPRVTIVHGDYRSGNFLFRETGEIAAVLDWEMAHLGDPHEDLAWAMDPLWSQGQSERPAGMIPLNEAITHWERASGMTVNPEALAWWRIFAAVKGIAIWVSSAKEFSAGTNTDPVLAFSGWYCTVQHNQILLELLGH